MTIRITDMTDLSWQQKHDARCQTVFPVCQGYNEPTALDRQRRSGFESYRASVARKHGVYPAPAPTIQLGCTTKITDISTWRILLTFLSGDYKIAPRAS